MRPSIRGHIVRYVATHLPFKQYLPLEYLSDFVRKCATARSFIGSHVRERRAALMRGDKLTDESDVLQAMVENEGLWSEDEVTEYVSFLLQVRRHVHWTDSRRYSTSWCLDTTPRLAPWSGH